MTVIKPVGKRVKLFKESKFKTALRREGKDANKTVKGLMLTPTTTWSEQPKIITTTKFELDSFSALSRTAKRRKSSQRYIWVSKGTPSYTIVAKKSPALKFRRRFVPKTKPGRLAAASGSKSGAWVSKKTVIHPGIRPRRFTEKIVKWIVINDFWINKVLKAIKEAKV